MSFKFNIFTGTFDLVNSEQALPAENFSFLKVTTGQTVIVPENQQMLYSGTLRVDGTLRVLGQVRDISPVESFYGWRVIPIGKVVVIPSGRQMLFTNGMRVLGTIRVQGQLKETGFL